MNSFYFITALITAGVSLSAGLINLSIGSIKNKEKTDFVFGIMCLSIFVFFLVPPVGFILEDKAPYLLEIKIKRIFNFGFSALFPWFIFYYCRFKNKLIPITVNAIVFTCYIVMWFTTKDSVKPAWVYFVLLHDTIIVVYGFYGGIVQLRNGDKNKGKWFLMAMSLVAVLYVLTMINQLGNNYFGKLLGTKLFFPENLYPLPIILIMGVRLRANIFEKHRLEKLLHWGDMRWDSFVRGIHLLILEIDNNGIIKYINPYALKTLGYRVESELIGKNWFETFVPTGEVENRKLLFREILLEGEGNHYINKIIAKNGETLIINWTNVLVRDVNANICGSMNIGLNITGEEKALEKVGLLEAELKKENLFQKNEPLFDRRDSGIIGESETILYAIQKARQVAATNATVLLEGETGVGKELFANLIHKSSNRCNNVFIKINCSALPPDLIESELFGHDKGAFTGALQARKGRFELADGGTIFLDEIGEMPLSLQPKLLRVLQSGEFERVGAQNTMKVDVRVISATNKDLLHAVRTGHFREDLYYRLNVFPITIPALRHRKEDIPLLVNYFVDRFSAENKKTIVDISQADLARLTGFSWPGNVRELINVIERSVISSKGNTLKLDWLNTNISHKEISAQHLSMEEVERLHLLKVLKETNWRINGNDGAAAKLGLNPNTLRSRLKKLNISRSEAQRHQ